MSRTQLYSTGKKMVNRNPRLL
jgi:hypothetical protein